MLQMRPRQILYGQRLFDGTIWVGKRDYSCAKGRLCRRSSRQKENLFPHFTTIRQKVDGKYWFPVTTYGDDTL